MTQAQSAAQKKAGNGAARNRQGWKAVQTGAERKRLGGKPEPQEKPTPGPPPPRKHSTKKRAAGFPAAHMEKDAVTPT